MKDLGLVPFVRVFPQQAATETRVLTTRGYPGLPDDEYGLLESYCPDPRCTCRRVMLNVVGRRQQAILATVSYGFDRDAPLAGPFLDPLNPRSRCADTLLRLVEEILENPAYVARLEAHYRQVKGVMADPFHPAQQLLAHSAEDARIRSPRPRGTRRKRRDR